MQPISSISEIPFREHDLLELLNLDHPPDDPEADFYAYGYSRADAICLTAREDPEPLPIIRNALVLALHAADDPEPLDTDIELEFFIDEVELENDEDYSVTVLLSDFLDKWLPMVSGGETAIVLAVCNPLCATIDRPAKCGGTPVYYAMGDVVSYVEGDGIADFVYLMADEWRIA